MTNNIFNLEHIKDLPYNLIKDLRLATRNDLLILSLFKKKNQLNLSEIIVGSFRLYKLKRTRGYVTTTCYRISKKGLLRATENKGGYEITEMGLLILEAEND